ncbi:oxygen-dependent protoporphyrinogen oxidase, partial [Spiromyces aspiralis]
VADLGLQDQVVTVDRAAPATLNRFLFFGGRQRALPVKPVHLLTRFARPLWGAPYTVLRDLLAPRNGPPADPAAGDDRESVGSLVSQRLGSALDDNVVSAVINGIYVAGTRVLSSRAAATPLWRSERSTGSVLLGLHLPLEGRPSGPEGGEEGPWQLQRSAGAQALWARLEAASMYSFRGGMQTLTDQLAERLVNSSNVTLIRGRAWLRRDPAGGLPRLGVAGGTHFRDILGDPATVLRVDLLRHAMDTMRRALGVSREPVLAAAHVQRQCISAYPVGYVGMLEEVD